MVSYLAILLLIVIAAVIAVLMSRPRARPFGVAAIVVLVVFSLWRYRSLEEQHARRMQEEAIVAARQQNDRMRARVDSLLRGEEARPRLQTAAELAAAPIAGVAPRSVLRAPEPDDVPPGVFVEDDLVPHGNVEPAAADAAPPAWLTLASGKQPDGRYCAVVAAEDWDVRQCWWEIRAWQIPTAVRNYAIAEIGGRWPVQRLDGPMSESLISDSFVETRYVYTDRNGPRYRYKVYALLDIPPTVRDTLIARRTDDLVDARLIYTSLAALLAVGVVLVVFGYLKTDDATDGRYTRPLRVVAGLSLAGLFVAGVALAAFAIAEESEFGGFMSIM